MYVFIILILSAVVKLNDGALRQNRTAITGLQNQCTTIVLVGLWYPIVVSNHGHRPYQDRALPLS